MIDIPRAARVIVLLAGLGALVLVGSRVVDLLAAEVRRA